MDIVSKINGNTLSATEFNQIPTELETVQTSSGQTSSDAILDQVAIGIARYSACNFYTDSGTANAYILSPKGSFKSPVSATVGYFDGMTIKFRAGNANTGASTVNVNSAGVKNLKQADGTTDLAAGNIPTTQDSVFRYNGTAFCLVSNSSAVNENLIINPSFAIDQRNNGTSTAISDDTYCLDRWYALTQTAAINISQQTLQENGQATNIRLTQNQASAQRMGIAQIIEANNSQPYRGATLAESIRIRCSSSQAIRYAILEWTGTADSVTSDVVLDWTSASYTAGGFFLGSNLTVTAVGSITPSAATWTNVTPLIGTLGSSTNNLIVFVWTEGTAAQNVTLDIGEFKLEKSAAATPFVPRLYGDELLLCQRYCEKITATTAQFISSGLAQGSGRAYGIVYWKVQKYATPTITASAFTTFIPLNGVGAAQPAFTGGSFSGNTNSVFYDLSGSSGLTSGQVCTIQLDAGGYIMATSEL